MRRAEGAPQGVLPAVALLLALAAGGLRAQAALDVVRLSQTISTDAQIADDKGFFAEQGIKIQWTGKQAHGPAVLVTVAAGENDFAGTVSSAVFLARARGAKLKIIAATSATSPGHPFFQYLVKDGSGIARPGDFVGKKVVAPPTTIAWYPLVVWLKRNHVDFNKVEFVSLPSPLAALQAFKEGKVDVLGVMADAPPGSVLLAEGGVHLVPGVSDAEVLKITQTGGWAASEDFLAKHPDLTRRFLKALGKGAEWGNQHPAEAEAILDRLNEVPPELARYSKWRRGNPDLRVDPQSIQKWVAVLEEFGQIQPGAVRPEDSYTNDFVPKP